MKVPYFSYTSIFSLGPHIRCVCRKLAANLCLAHTSGVFLLAVEEPAISTKFRGGPIGTYNLPAKPIASHHPFLGKGCVLAV